MIIEIPGEITFSRTYNIPSVPVELPMTAHARTFGQGGITAVSLCFALPVTALLLIFVVSFMSRGVQFQPIGSVIFLSMLAFLAVAFIPKAFFGIVDFARGGPTLILDSHGFTDRRGSISLRWSDISSAQVTYTGHHMSVRLGLLNPIPSRAMFDRGGTGLLGRRKADVYEVSVGNLSERTYVLSQTMLVMVRQNGGTVKR